MFAQGLKVHTISNEKNSKTKKQGNDTLGDT